MAKIYALMMKEIPENVGFVRIGKVDDTDLLLLSGKPATLKSISGRDVIKITDAKRTMNRIDKWLENHSKDALPEGVSLDMAIEYLIGLFALGAPQAISILRILRTKWQFWQR